MSDIAVLAENIGKSYLISHQGNTQKYNTMREVIANGVKSVGSRAKSVVSKQHKLERNELEEFWALKDINFEIKKGDAVGIIGRNGAGKSTLLKILSRITVPTIGRMSVSGRVASLMEVGTGFHNELTGRENIFLNGAILGMKREEIKRKFDEIIEFAGVERFLDTPVKRYSSGMYVRLAFSVAAHLEPEILVVDEVLAVGDAEFQKKCLGKMDSANRNEGRTVFFVSHNIASIKALCTKGIFMEKGRIGSIGNISDIVSLYKGSMTADFNIDANTKFNERYNRCAASGRSPGAIRFTSIIFKDEEFLQTTSFKRNTCFYMDIQYEVFEDSDSLLIAIRFDSEETFQPVTNNVFVISQTPLAKGTKDTVRIRFFDLPLPSGEYTPYVIAINSRRDAYDIIDRLITNVPTIEITTDSESASRYLEIPAKWESIA